MSHLKPPLRKDIRHLNSRTGVGAAFQACSPRNATPSMHSDVSSMSSFGQESPCHELRARRSLLSSEFAPERPRSLGRSRPWSDADAKPRMAQRTPESITLRSPRPRSPEEARLAPAAGRPSFCSHYPHLGLRLGQPTDCRARSPSEDRFVRSPTQTPSTSCSRNGRGTTWANLVAEAEALGAAFTTSKNLTLSESIRRGNQGAPNQLAPAGRASSPSFAEAPQLLRTSSWASMATTASSPGGTRLSDGLSALVAPKVFRAGGATEALFSSRAAPPPVVRLRSAPRLTESPRKRPS